MILGLDFPPISHVTEWPSWGSGPLAVNKVVVLMWLSVAIVFVLMYVGGRQQSLVPRGAQNVAESAVDFVQENVILQTIGPDGLSFTPFLLTIFTFVFVCNIWEIIPLAQMPVNARIALPAFMAVVVWVLYLVVGIMHQGPLKYFKNSIVPPGVPWFALPLVSLIELAQIVIVRPLSLAVRLFANMIAGHLLLVSFAVITQALFEATIVGAALPFALLVALTGFEVLVSFLQAYIFTILAAVYIGSSMHPEH